LSAVIGQDELVLALVLATVDPALGGVLLRGQKGSAKTTAARGLAHLLPGGVPFVELPVGASEDRVVGTVDLRAVLASGDQRFAPGLLHQVHGGVLYVDEVNLLPDHLVDVLLDVAASGVNRVEREGVSHQHPSRFVLVGSMNPEEGELRPQFLDRFGLSVTVTAPVDPAVRTEVVRRRLAFDADPQGFADRFGDAEAELARRLAGATPAALPDHLVDAVAMLCVAAGAEGLRGDLVCCRAAAALAGWEGRAEATTDDVRRVARLALGHRRRRAPFEAPGFAPGELEAILDEVLPLGASGGEHGAGGRAPGSGDRGADDRADTEAGAPGRRSGEDVAADIDRGRAAEPGGPGAAGAEGWGAAGAEGRGTGNAAGPGATGIDGLGAAGAGRADGQGTSGPGEGCAQDRSAETSAAATGGWDATGMPGSGPDAVSTETQGPGQRRPGTGDGGGERVRGDVPLGGHVGIVGARGAAALGRLAPAGGSDLGSEHGDGDATEAGGRPFHRGGPGRVDGTAVGGRAAAWTSGPPGPGMTTRAPVSAMERPGGNRGSTGGRSQHEVVAGGARGRRIGAAVPEGPVRAVAVTATVRAAAARGRSVVTAADLREATVARPVGRLVVLAVDVSGSMGASARLDAAAAAAEALLLDAYQRRDRVAVVGFGGRGATLAVAPTGSVEVARARLTNLATGGRTPLAAGLALARQVADGAVRSGHRPVLAVVSDGRATVADGAGDPVAAALAVAEGIRRRGVPSVVIDVEDGPVRLGLAGRLADALGGRLVVPETVSGPVIVDAVRAVADS
jgi:magnesium chelatase subunit D